MATLSDVEQLVESVVDLVDLHAPDNELEFPTELIYDVSQEDPPLSGMPLAHFVVDIMSTEHCHYTLDVETLRQIKSDQAKRAEEARNQRIQYNS